MTALLPPPVRPSRPATPTSPASPPAVPPPATAGPAPRLWTRLEFEQLCRLGLFRDRRVMLIRGVIYEEATMDPPHAIALERLCDALRAVFTKGWRHRVQMPLHVDERNDPLPDYAVLPGVPHSGSGHPTTASLVVEVADTSLRMDVTEKAERYATAGVADYWVLDLNARQLIVFRDPVTLPAGLGATAYRTRITLAAADIISPLAAPTATITVGDLLP